MLKSKVDEKYLLKICLRFVVGRRNFDGGGSSK